MSRTENRKRLCLALLCLNLIFIWGNSLMPGEISRQISQWVGDLLGGLLGRTEIQTEGGHGLLRKLAHVTEFACLGVLLYWHLTMAGKGGFPLAAQTLLGGFTAACIDETIQIFAVDRGPGLLDVLIDTGGTAAGMIFAIIGYALIRKIHGKKQSGG